MENDPLKVLLIEDVPVYVGMLERILTSPDFEVISVASLRDGVTSAANRDFDVVLLDLGLPDSNGLKTFSEFINHFPNLPVVILTGSDDEDMAAKAVQRGAQDYLIKGPYLMRGEAGKRLLTQSLRYAVERQQIQKALINERNLLEFRVSERTLELRQTNLRLSSLIGAIPDLLCRLNNQGLILDIKVPKTFEKYIPNPQQAVGKHYSETFSEILTDQGRYYYRKALQDKGIQIFENRIALGGKLYYFEVRIVASKGSDVLILIRDVTQSKALERMWRRYEFIANTSKDLLILIDQDYRYQAVNDAYCESNNFIREILIGKTMAEVMGEEIFISEIKPHVDMGLSGHGHTITGIYPFGPLRGRFFEFAYYPFFSQDNQVTNVVIVSRDRTEYHQNEEMLKRYNQRLQYLATRLVSAQEEERRRISLELHDEAGQALTALKLKLGLTQKKLSPDSDEIKQQLIDAISLVETTMDQVRTLAHNLRPPALDAVGINQAIEDYCQRFSGQSEIDVHYQGEVISDLPGYIQINLYRMLQEALTNVIKHAEATKINVKLSTEDGFVLFQIADNGIGLEPQDGIHKPRDKGIGLTGIEERMEALGGRLEINSQPGRGTELIAYVPWKEEK
jgi:signal transduction histidine kinase/DNA-binding response OmpR family regulator